MTEVERYYVGVDVGTGSARAALVTPRGKIVKMAVQEIQTWKPQLNHMEQSSNNIWEAVVKAVKEILAGVNKDSVQGIGFDATCSLVIIGPEDAPLTVSTTAEPEQNVILWMDHRAQAEADQINDTKHPLLQYVGGTVSLEMELPKLLWLKKNIPETYQNMVHAFDLPDFLTWRATKNNSRSLCSVTCKWNYDGEAGTWNADFLRRIDLKEVACKLNKLGRCVKPPGNPVGNGLSDEAAGEFGLNPGTPVGSSMIDAHAGALALFGVRSSDLNGCRCGRDPIEGKMSIIAGTSTCHMSVAREPIMAMGIWGPYKDALMEGYYLHEGGQSAAGALLDLILESHPTYPSLKSTHGDNAAISKYLNEMLGRLADERNVEQAALLTKDFHVWPDYHGNRSPVADPNMRGMICGLDMSANEDNLAITYLAFVQALAYGTRYIIETLVESGRKPFEQLLFCGGLSKNTLYVQTHADVCNISTLVPDEQEMMLVGAGILGAYASGQYPTLSEASLAMAGPGQMKQPNKDTICYHNRKYKLFLEMMKDQRKYQKMMAIQSKH